MDLALLIADGSQSGRADPAYDAHALPIGEWAMAVWEYWYPVKSLQRIVDDACERLESAKNKWAVCYGPGAALVMTCRRIGWTVVTATHFITDTGEHLQLHLDPPCVVVKHCFQAVQRWRWKRIERVRPQLAANGSGRGPLIEPIWQLRVFANHFYQVRCQSASPYPACAHAKAADHEALAQNGRWSMPCKYQHMFMFET